MWCWREVDAKKMKQALDDGSGEGVGDLRKNAPFSTMGGIISGISEALVGSVILG